MRSKGFAVAGIVLILAGVYGLIRPNVMMPAQRQRLQVAGQDVVMETRRIVAIPRPMGALVILSGIALILLSTQKSRAGVGR